MIERIMKTKQIKKVMSDNGFVFYSVMKAYNTIGTISNEVSNNLIEKLKFKRVLGYYPDLKNPITFNEKICWKKINDRSKLLTITADKYKVYKYVENKLGKKEAEKILIPLYGVYSDPTMIPFKDLPKQYVLKINHQCGGNLFITDNKKINRDEIITKCNYWLKLPYGQARIEWAYKNIPRRIIVQKYLDFGKTFPPDFKLHMFKGKCKMIQIIWDRPKETKEIIYTPAWKPLKETFTYPKGTNFPKPSNMNKMIKIAEKLSEDFDYARIDLYDFENKILFGEITHYPQSGMLNCSKQLDLKIGNWWKL